MRSVNIVVARDEDTCKAIILFWATLHCVPNSSNGEIYLTCPSGETMEEQIRSNKKNIYTLDKIFEDLLGLTLLVKKNKEKSIDDFREKNLR